MKEEEESCVERKVIAITLRGKEKKRSDFEKTRRVGEEIQQQCSPPFETKAKPVNHFPFQYNLQFAGFCYPRSFSVFVLLCGRIVRELALFELKFSYLSCAVPTPTHLCALNRISWFLSGKISCRWFVPFRCACFFRTFPCLKSTALTLMILTLIPRFSFFSYHSFLFGS